MNVLGIDLAASAPSTGVVMLASTDAGRWSAIEPDGAHDDDALVAYTVEASVVGIDAPLGWPSLFVEAVAAHATFRPWPGTPDRSELTHRETDRATRQLVGRTPLSVSADKLGSVAMRCALLQQRWATEVWAELAPRDGSGLLVETYPTAAFLAWQIDHQGYKSRNRERDPRPIRARILDVIAESTRQWLDLNPIRARAIESDHVLDALVCALVAVASRSAATHLPTAEQHHLALTEGWIHIPSEPLANITPPRSGT